MKVVKLSFILWVILAVNINASQAEESKSNELNVRGSIDNEWIKYNNFTSYAHSLTAFLDFFPESMCVLSMMKVTTKALLVGDLKSNLKVTHKRSIIFENSVNRGVKLLQDNYKYLNETEARNAVYLNMALNESNLNKLVINSFETKSSDEIFESIYLRYNCEDLIGYSL
ncbi:hypothetical protein [Aliivibrio kagoshimensis]|uniref:hypothetical protein n=1 Tax=Aliivibrio kagoshimensis TaxID=2910230 RepID=UPI003D0F33D9